MRASGSFCYLALQPWESCGHGSILDVQGREARPFGAVRSVGIKAKAGEERVTLCVWLRPASSPQKTNHVGTGPSLGKNSMGLSM